MGSTCSAAISKPSSRRPSGPLRVYCTHLSHVGPAQRLPQVEALMKAVKRCDDGRRHLGRRGARQFMFQEPAFAVPASAIVAGDFNFTPTHPEYPRVAASRSRRCLERGRKQRGGVDSFPDEGRIDHVFITPDLTPRVGRAWIDHDTEASDHWPLFVEFA